MKIKLENACVLAIDFQKALMPVMQNRLELERKSTMFLKGCRVLDIPIIVTQQYTKGLGDTVDTVKEALGDFDYIEKTHFSCCGSEEFLKKLKDISKKDIIITGIETHVCVMGTALDLLDLGYNVYLLADCVSSRNENDMKYALLRMRDNGVIATTAEAALFEMLLDAKHPKRKEITNLIKTLEIS